MDRAKWQFRLARTFPVSSFMHERFSAQTGNLDYKQPSFRSSIVEQDEHETKREWPAAGDFRAQWRVHLARVPWAKEKTTRGLPDTTSDVSFLSKAKRKRGDLSFVMNYLSP